MKVCKVCGRPLKEWETKKCGYGMCVKHYHQMRDFGKIVDASSRTMHDPNPIKVIGNYAEVICHSKKGDTYKVKISLEDIPLISRYKWSVMNQGYAITYSPNRMFMHQLLCPVASHEVVDHINRDKLDNRRGNLRALDKRGNACNSKLINHTNETGIRGVFKTKSDKYVGRVNFNNKIFHSRSYSQKEEAAYARYILTALCYPVEVPYVEPIWEGVLNSKQMEVISKEIFTKFHNKIYK
jgi:hypothetical protein